MKTFLLLLLFLLPDPAPTIQWTGAQTGIDEPRVELITNDEALASAWRMTHGHSTEGQPLVNFDRCRLVLVLNGADTDVFGLQAVELGRSRREVLLRLEARGPQAAEGGSPRDTTAWGLYIVPRTPASVRVQEKVSSNAGGEPEWKDIAMLGEDRGEGNRPRRQRPVGRPVPDDADGGLRPDLSLLQPRRNDDRDADVKGDPYLALFQSGNKELLFVAARHEQDIENSPTHRLVRRAIEGFQPQAVIVEGLTTSTGPQPERFLQNARRRVPTGRAGESLYAAMLADDRGAVVIGGEPDAEETTRVVREAGYSDDDLLGFLLARRAVSMVRNDRLDDSFTDSANRALRQLKAKYQVESQFDAEDFLEWYEDRIGEPFDARRVKREVSPSLVDHPTVLREMAILVMKAREYNLVELEARMLRTHDRVMVVYGSGHLRWERRLLEKMMGPPVLVANDVPDEVLQERDEHLERLRRPWTRKLSQPPRYFISHGYDERWSAAIKSGIDAARDYLGNHGPVQVYVVGQENDELSDPAHQEAIAQAFCQVHNAGSDRPMDDCLSTDGQEMAQKAVDGESEAFMTMAMDSDPPTAELVFINAHTFGEADMPTRGIHEYTHVYQKSFEFTPTWMMEGGAELLACHLGEQHGWGERDQTMEWYARHLDEAEDLEYTIRDMEEIETAEPDVAKWHRELAYDAGAWAVAYLVDQSPSRSIREFYVSYYPSVQKDGWEQALLDYMKVESMESFYAGFDSFMDRSLEERLAVLKTLRD